ncbi:hypothetical protein HDU86_002355 [Geranomyces michiganensis]|nr:hypothetical protein HDU86_002355 [Geranomyces michiganensis]
MDKPTVALHPLEGKLKKQERKLLDDGLPALGTKGPHTSSADGKPHKTRDHPPARAEVKNFELFEGSEWIGSDGQWSSMWRNYPEGLPSQWNNEADIQSRVAESLRDLTAYAGLVGKIAIGIEITPTAKIKEGKGTGAAANVEAAGAKAEKDKGSRPDIWIVGSKDTVPSQLPIGVGEVKQPETNEQRAVCTGGLQTLKAGIEQPSVLLGQIYDYLVDASTVSGLRWSFGILTNYHEWRICWLPNADQAAASKSLDEYVNLQSTSILQEQERLVYTTRVYKHHERDLMRVLIHLLHKMWHTPRNEDLQPLVTPRKYPCLEEYGWTWSILDKSNDNSIRKLSYEQFKSDSSRFFLLENYHRKTDDLVWLAAAPPGKGKSKTFKLLVLKFRHKAPTDEADLNRECQIWKTWAPGATVLTLDSRPVLAMPFAFHARFNESKVDRLLEEGKGVELEKPENIFVSFQTAGRWLIDSASDVPGAAGSDIQDESEVIAAVKAIFETLKPLGIARLAITGLLAKGYCLQNNDVLWRHIALLPTHNKAAKTWDVKPIVIDLARVEAAKSSDVEAAKTWLAATKAQQLEKPVTYVDDQVGLLKGEYRDFVETRKSRHGQKQRRENGTETLLLASSASSAF